MNEPNLELDEASEEEGDEEEEEPAKPQVFTCPIRWKKRVLLTNPKMLAEAIDELKDLWEIHVLPTSFDRNLLFRYCQGMEGIILDNPLIYLDSEFFKVSGLGLKAISIVGRSAHQIDLAEVKKRVIHLGVCPTELALESAAEVAIGAAVILLKRFKEGNEALTSGDVHIDNPVWLLGRDLKECCVGIVGLGKLGSSIAVRLLGFGPKKMVYYSRRLKKAGDKFAIERVLLDELYQTSDVIFLCVPFNDKTRGMIDSIVLSRMRPSTILINVSHGALYNYDHLYCALKKGLLNAAVLDSEVGHAPSPRHPINKLDNFIMLPEVSRSSIFVRVRMCFTAVKNINHWASQGYMLFPYVSNEFCEDVETEEEKKQRIFEEIRLGMEEERKLMEKMEDDTNVMEEDSSVFLLNLENEDDVKLPP